MTEGSEEEEEEEDEEDEEESKEVVVGFKREEAKVEVERGEVPPLEGITVEEVTTGRPVVDVGTAPCDTTAPTTEERRTDFIVELMIGLEVLFCFCALLLLCFALKDVRVLDYEQLNSSLFVQCNTNRNPETVLVNQIMQNPT